MERCDLALVTFTIADPACNRAPIYRDFAFSCVSTHRRWPLPLRPHVELRQITEIFYDDSHCTTGMTGRLTCCYVITIVIRVNYWSHAEVAKFIGINVRIRGPRDKGFPSDFSHSHIDAIYYLAIAGERAGQKITREHKSFPPILLSVRKPSVAARGAVEKSSPFATRIKRLKDDEGRREDV